MKFKYRLALVVLIVLVMFTLHNSFWLWEFDARLPFLFGFMPFAFYYYVFFAIFSVLALKLIIKLAWPDPPADFLVQTGESEKAQ